MDFRFVLQRIKHEIELFEENLLFPGLVKFREKILFSSRRKKQMQLTHAVILPSSAVIVALGNWLFANAIRKAAFDNVFSRISESNWPQRRKMVV